MRPVELGDQPGQVVRQDTEYPGRQLEEDRQTAQHRLQPLKQVAALAPTERDPGVFHPDRAPPVVGEAEKDPQIGVVSLPTQVVELHEPLGRPPEEIWICLAADRAWRRPVSSQAKTPDLAPNLAPDLVTH